MSVKRRTQRERSTSTRAALLSAARELFAEHGYGAVGTERIVRAAGVTRGALYHQFRDKSDLFLAVFEAEEAALVQRIGPLLGDVGSPGEALAAGVDAWLEVCADPAVQRIVLIDAPSVLGWERWREVGLANALGLVEAVLGAAMEAGTLERQPVRPLAHVLIGALDEAALYIARADDPPAAREEMRGALHKVLDGLRR